MQLFNFCEIAQNPDNIISIPHIASKKLPGYVVVRLMLKVMEKQKQLCIDWLGWRCYATVKFIENVIIGKRDWIFH